MQAVVLSIGSELLRGDIIDTNAAFLTRELFELGIAVRRVEQVGDDLDDLARAIHSAVDLAEITVTTGGLGPTQDDLTREAIAAALDESLFLDPSLVADIEARFAAMQRRMIASNTRQAMRIPSAEAIANPRGTAPGWSVEKDGRRIVAMPGPPGEMRPMWTERVRPLLASLNAEVLATRTLMTFGMGESMVEHRIAEVISWRPDVVVATYAKQAGVEVHITARCQDAEAAERLVTQAETKVRQKLGDVIFGTGDVTLPAIVGEILRKHGLTIAVMESATGGDLSSSLTDVPGSSEYFLGGIVSYAPEVKARYGVDRAVMERHGVISEETAGAMAAAARRELGSEVGVGITGVAGSEPLENHPPGTCFVAVTMGGTVEVREIHRPGDRETVKYFFAQSALDLVRRTVLASVGART